MGNGTFAMSDSRAYKEFADVDLGSTFGGLKKRATNKVTLDMWVKKHSHAYFFLEKGPKEKKALIFCVHFIRMFR